MSMEKHLLAINRKLGYQPEPGFLLMRAALAQAASGA